MMNFADPTLPDLRTALDVGAVHDLLHRAFPEFAMDVELVAVHIQDARYIPDAPCWILYRLRVRRPGTRSKSVFVSAQVLRSHEDPAPVPPELLARFRAQRNELLRTPMAVLSEPRMAFYAFPVDSGMPWLFDVLDPEIMRQRLGPLWAERNLRVRDVEIRLLGYTPQARAAFLFEVLAESRETGVPEVRRIIAKTHAVKAASALFAGSWALWRAAGKKVNLAPPVGYVPAASITLQEQIRGERLGGLTTVQDFVKRAGQTARAVSALHALSIPLSTRRRPEDESRVVRRWGGVLAAIRPDMARRIEGLRDRMASELEARTNPGGPVHGDFHHTNVLVQDRGVAIIDLDEMAYGDPLLDVGRFLASLRIPSLRAFGSISSLAPAGETFLAEYLRRAGGDEKRVRLFEAATLFTSAASAFRIQRPNWEEEIVLLVDEAERILQKAGCGSAALPRAKALPPPSPMANPGPWATDGTYMRAVLDPYIRKVYGAELSSCRVLGGSKGSGDDRYSYHLRGRREGDKWSVRVQGLAWRRHGARELLQQLEILRAALGEESQVPLFPRPVAFLRTLALIVWEPPTGVRFSSLLGTKDGLEAAARVAASLAALHQADVKLDRQHPPEKEMQSLRGRVKKLESERPELHERARRLFSLVEQKSRQAPVRSGPALRTVHPHNILLGERVAFAKVESVTLSHPLHDVGDFLARLALLGLSGSAEAAARAREQFVEVYTADTGGNGMAAGIDVFEAAALLRLACAHANPEFEAGIAEQLLHRAEARLELS